MNTTHPGTEPARAGAAPVSRASARRRELPAGDIDEGDLLLRVTGFVPAAEFEPFVLRVARRLGLQGWIRQEPTGALIRAVGMEAQLVRLVRALRDAPASTRIRSLDTETITAETPPVPHSFVALVEEVAPRHEDKQASPALANVA